jgi:hypothetical protein
MLRCKGICSCLLQYRRHGVLHNGSQVAVLYHVSVTGSTSSATCCSPSKVAGRFQLQLLLLYAAFCCTPPLYPGSCSRAHTCNACLATWLAGFCCCCTKNDVLAVYKQLSQRCDCLVCPCTCRLLETWGCLACHFCIDHRSVLMP